MAKEKGFERLYEQTLDISVAVISVRTVLIAVKKSITTDTAREIRIKTYHQR